MYIAGRATQLNSVYVRAGSHFDISISIRKVRKTCVNRGYISISIRNETFSIFLCLCLCLWVCLCLCLCLCQSVNQRLSVLQISTVHADGVSKLLCQNFFFLASGHIVSAGKIFRYNNGYKQRLGPLFWQKDTLIKPNKLQTGLFQLLKVSLSFYF